MFSFSLRITDNTVIDLLLNYKKTTEDLSPILKDISLFIQAKIRQHFDTEMGSEGKWLKSKRAQKDGGLTLTKTERLRYSFEKDSAYRFTKNKLEVVTDIVYAPTHQFGLTVNIFGRGKPYKFVKRDFVWLSPEDIKYIQELITTYLKDKVA